MRTQIWRWHLHRTMLDRLKILRPYSNHAGRKRCLFISERDPICQTQLFPYFYHAVNFAERERLEIRELPLSCFLQGKHPFDTAVDAVFFQTWFDLSPEALVNVAKKIQAAWPEAKIAYLDWFAPTDLRYAQALDEHITVYVKKQALRDKSQYGQPTLGDTNLTDYYARRFGIDLPETCFPLPEGFADKLVLSPHFAFSSHMLPYFFGEFPSLENRSIDLHARIAVKGTEWYTRMRQEALDKVTGLESQLKVVCRGRVSRRVYFKELFASKLCFSPFGYGEVCWRDFEAMFTGSLLLKPDMSHLDCYPEIFIPNETYVPLAWDLSDFEDKVSHYLMHPQERARITRNAFELLKQYFKKQQFLEDIYPLFNRLGLEPVE